jgi:hypothetical protein
MVGYFTVPHTGTQYFRKHYFGERGDAWKDLGDPSADDVVFAHCGGRDARAISEFQGEIITTYRDPLLVAVSWYARRKFERGYDAWRSAWESWASDVRPRARHVLRVDSVCGEPVNSSRHNSLAHYLYDRGDMAELFKLIDESQVQWARDLAHAHL